MVDIDEARAEAFDAFLAGERKSGKKVQLLTERAGERIEVIPTGIWTLDVALGVGGLPRGRIVELYGPESSGKTGLALNIAGRAQRHLGLPVGFVDAEHSLDPDYAQMLGVDLDLLAMYQPDTGEDGLNMARRMTASGAFGLIVVDSTAALVPEKELEGEVGDMNVGLQARMITQALRPLAGEASRSNTTVIFINQLRMQIGQMFGNPETTPGGKALKFYSSVRMDVRSSPSKKNYADSAKTIATSQGTTVKVAKNKVAPPMRKAEYLLDFTHGIDEAGTILDAAKQVGLVEVRGASITNVLTGEKHVGRDNFRDAMAEDPVKLAEWREQLLTMLFDPPSKDDDSLDEDLTPAAV